MDLEDIKRRMHGAVSVLGEEFAGLRTGRASISLLDPIMVDIYGTSMPVNQVATVSVPEPRMISVQVWDKGSVGAVDRAIRESDLGLNPITEGQLLRIPIPELNEERRHELVKVAHKYAEQARVAVRNVRRDGLDSAKREEKEGELSQDELHALHDKVQKLTDDHIAEIDAMLAAKESEILQV
jgi:ribosome recycling factor